MWQVSVDVLLTRWSLQRSVFLNSLRQDPSWHTDVFRFACLAVEAVDNHRPFFEVLDVVLEWEQATNRRRSEVGQIDLREALYHQLFQTLLQLLTYTYAHTRYKRVSLVYSNFNLLFFVSIMCCNDRFMSILLKIPFNLFQFLYVCLVFFLLLDFLSWRWSLRRSKRW